MFSQEIPAVKAGKQPAVPYMKPALLKAAAAMFPVVRSYVDFVALCAHMERKTGEPTRVYASY